MRRRSRFPFSSLLILLFAGILFWFYNSEYLDKTAPYISAPQECFWNLKEPLEIDISDKGGVRQYQIFMIKNDARILLDYKELSESMKHVSVKIPAPQELTHQDKNIELEIQATDTSLWHFLRGNLSTHKIRVTIDTKRPTLQVIAQSYGITRGGSALVIFHADDEFLEHVEIGNAQERFLTSPFSKKGIYAALIAWPITQERINPKIIITDSAGNKTIKSIDFLYNNRRYQQSKIKLKDSFIDGKISTLIEEINERQITSFENHIQKFKYINEEIRSSNERFIAKIVRTHQSNEPKGGFLPLPFYPLRYAMVVANFGDHRFFEYGGEVISESYHLGLDLASVRNAAIFSSNAGRVIFAGFLGIYGNSVIIDHGFGLMTLYSHMSKIDVQVDDVIPPNTIIGKTGVSGLALGDHLHFGTIIQGEEVNCLEWMDKRWIKENITDVIERANAFINTLED